MAWRPYAQSLIHLPLHAIIFLPRHFNRIYLHSFSLRFMRASVNLTYIRSFFAIGSMDCMEHGV